MRDSFLPFSLPDVGEEEAEAASRVIRSRWLTTGAETRLFEQEFAEYLGRRSAVAVNSWTAGAHLALVALGIGPGDEVVVPALTFAATANVVAHVGATPVIVDVEAETLTMDPDHLAAACTHRTRVVIPVHYGGNPADMDAIREVASRYRAHVLEDAAHAVATEYRGARVGSSEDSIASFSFYATKNLTSAEGGMLVGPDPILERARSLALHGLSSHAYQRYERSSPYEYDLIAPGFKYNLSDVHAAIGRVQLQRLSTMQARRLEIVSAYLEGLAAFPEIELPYEAQDSRSSWHLFVIKLRLDQMHMDRRNFVRRLQERNIGVSVHFRPLHHYSYYASHARVPYSCPIADDAYDRIVSLPLSSSMNDADVRDVIDAVGDVLAEASI